MKGRLEIVSKISDKALIAIVAFLLVAIYFIAIQPTASLHGKIAKLEALGGSDAASILPAVPSRCLTFRWCEPVADTKIDKYKA